MSTAIQIGSPLPHDLGAPATVPEGLDGWLAVYTCSRQEKRVAEQLQLRQVDCFLPLFKSQRNWNGRRAVVELALFPGYVFVRPRPQERIRVLSVPGVVRVVSFCGKPAVIRQAEIDNVRAALARGGVEPWPWMVAGKRVRVRAGALAGLEGVVVRRKNRLRVVVALESIMRAMSVEVDAAELEPAGPNGATK